MKWIVEEVWKMWVEPGKELLCFALVVDEVTIEFKEPSEDANDISSGEESWPDPVREEVEEEDVELPLPTMGVLPLEENDAPYPDPWIGVMNMDVTYRNIMVSGVDDDNVPPPISVGVGQRFMTKDALVMYLKDYCISRHVQFKAFGPAIHGFQFCRPFISVDETHLYEKYKGCLLIATSFDGDNQLFPVAFALVEKENIDTWTWFIACLARQVVRGRSPMCIISDRHSGIIRAVADVFPRPHRHRFCIRHIIANLKKRYSVKDLDKMVRRCASAETVDHYDHAIQNLEEACPGARAQLTEGMSPEQWALAYDGNMSFGKLTTNSSESENSLLKRARSLPVQTLASTIFYRMNAWFVHRREKAAQITTHLCPSVDTHLRTIVHDARHVYVVAYADGIFQAGEHKVVMADMPLLYDQDSHRSEAIWHGEDPGCLECTEHFQTLRHWPMDERMLSFIEAAGFCALHRVQWLRLDKLLITALVERWRSETNTFHLANGEMTITLEDVAVLLGLRVDGDSVTGSTWGDWMELDRVFLGVKLPPGSFQGGRLSLSWLRGQFSFCPDDATELVIQQHARAYLLHLVGATIFLDGSARGVHMAYLTLFEDFEAAGRYSWGAATLAFLYRELTKACHTGVVGIAGCLTLMQLWAWERLHDTARGTGAAGWPFRFQVCTYTVKWQSYLDFMQRLPAIYVEGRRIWLSRTPLICFEIVELHVPDRVMLQFGLEQVTPPEDVEHVTRISRKDRAGEDWALYHRDYIALWEARAESFVMGSRAHTPRHAPNDYMRWYLGATRRFISPPPTEPAIVYHPRGYTEEALLGCVRNVVERVNHRAALYPSSMDPHWLEIGHYCQSVLHSLPLLEGAIVGGDVSHAGEPSHVVEPARDRAPRRRRARRRPTAETTTRVEDSDKVPAVPEPTVLDLPPEQTPDTEPDPPLEQPLEQPIEQPQEEPSHHPPIRRIYTRRQKKAIGAPEPSSAL
ncbi:hypothetical protein H6P81_003304 [Aristolochia fimbriata]|uniref:Serine/threonine-protein phosphatase 7 long form-like n=1 Tax=Aristolochia fimbriata TaxID=158543 RepID=A0AAV7FDA0_ARIFI|nr:hypothetical protein H6P81_003304 [Aristolochia fimbriata]